MKEMFFMNRKKIVITLIFSILMGWLLEFICVFNFSTYKDIWLNADKKQSVSSDEMELINCKKHGNSGIVTSNNDAQIIAHDVNSYVGSVEIKLKKPVDHAWMLQIFYNTKKEEFSQETSSIKWVSKYQKSVLLEINQEVVDIRIDLGDEPDTLFLLNTITVNPSPFDYVLLVFNHISCIKVLVYTILIFLFGLFSINAYVMSGFVYTHRWLVGGSIILFCTICKIHGSSIGFYADVLPGYPYEELWGRYRGIRSDEFVVSTQMALAQVKAGFPWFSDLYRYSPTDMAVIAAQMIKNPVVVLYRPFQAGYLFFGAQHGLAFYWSARIVVCFLISFEFGRLFTNNKRKLAVAYALLVTLSPVIQWFFAAGGLIEILVFGQAAVLLLIRYIREEDFRYKLVYMAGMVVCAGGYVVCLYPAYQIPFFYVFLTCAVAVLIENRKAIKLRICDFIFWIGGLAVFAASMAYVITKSSDAIETIMHTVYPGSREVTGGTFSDLAKLFQGWSSIFWSVIDIENPCEASSFVDFFPLGIILSVPVLVYYKKRDIWVISFHILNIILLSFTAFQWPRVLAKFTLLSNVPIQRLIVSIGLLNLMLLIRCIAVSGFGQAYRFFVRIIVTILICDCCFYCAENYLNPLLKGLILCCVFFAVIVITNTKEKREDQFLCLCMVIAVIGGGIVNPVSSGLDVLYDNPIIRNMEKINNAEQGMWIVDTDFFIYNNLPAIVGAQAVNSVQIYPDSILWQKLGLDNKEDVWNRYAHLNLRISVKNTGNYLKLQNADLLRLTVSLNSVKEIGVKYILSNQDIKHVQGLDCLYEFGGYYIYQIE